MADRSRRPKGKGTDASPNPIHIKREPEDTEEEDGAPPEFCPAALGLCPVGTVVPPRPSPPHPLQKLNARGMPARIRKKNKLFFDDNIVNAPPSRSSPKRTSKTTPVKTPSKLINKMTKKPKSPLKFSPIADRRESLERHDPIRNSSPDRKTGQRIGMRLRNLLKLPKAHKWVCFEHFYSNIDKALLAGENDFRICLKESFPKLTDKNLTQVQWTKIRRIMGKPRRCSQAFFNEERKDLENKRQKIRYIQQRKGGCLSWKDLPNEIPMQLVIGTKVTARLRQPQDGIFTGTIEGVDTSNNTYRITFDRPGLGTHSVPDFEVLSNEPPDTINLLAVSQKARPRHTVPGLTSLYQNTGFSPPLVEKAVNDPLLGTGLNTVKLEETISGSYPVKFLESIIRITKILNMKKEKISKLRDLNCQAERHKSFGEKMPDEFERKYASVIIDLEKMNIDLQQYLNEVQTFCHEMAPGLCMAAMLAPSLLREKCRSDASTMVLKNNPQSLVSAKSMDLIIDLIALLLQVKSLTDSNQNAYELKVLQGTMNQIKNKLPPADQIIFQNCVEIHMQRIQSCLSSSGLLNTKDSSCLVTT